MAEPSLKEAEGVRSRPASRLSATVGSSPAHTEAIGSNSAQRKAEGVRARAASRATAQVGSGVEAQIKRRHAAWVDGARLGGVTVGLNRARAESK